MFFVEEQKLNLNVMPVPSPLVFIALFKINSLFL